MLLKQNELRSQRLSDRFSILSCLSANMFSFRFFSAVPTADIADARPFGGKAARSLANGVMGVNGVF